MQAADYFPDTVKRGPTPGDSLSCEPLRDSLLVVRAVPAGGFELVDAPATSTTSVLTFNAFDGSSTNELLKPKHNPSRGQLGREHTLRCLLRQPVRAVQPHHWVHGAECLAHTHPLEPGVDGAQLQGPVRRGRQRGVLKQCSLQPPHLVGLYEALAVGSADLEWHVVQVRGGDEVLTRLGLPCLG